MTSFAKTVLCAICGAALFLSFEVLRVSYLLPPQEVDFSFLLWGVLTSGFLYIAGLLLVFLLAVPLYGFNLTRDELGEASGRAERLRRYAQDGWRTLSLYLLAQLGGPALVLGGLILLYGVHQSYFPNVFYVAALSGLGVFLAEELAQEQRSRRVEIDAG